MGFCNAFDERLAQEGPAAVFLVDHEGLYRFDASWTRDAWERANGPHDNEWRWVLIRDRATGFVQLTLVTSPTLLAEHPRGDVRSFETEEGALAMRSTYGNPPVTPSW